MFLPQMSTPCRRLLKTKEKALLTKGNSAATGTLSTPTEGHGDCGLP
jgi:hypothetical protein